MKTLVVGLHQYLDRDTFLSDQYFTFRDVRAFFREGVMRVFSPNLSAIAVTTCLKHHGYAATYLDLALEFGIPFTAEWRAARDRELTAYLASHPCDNVFIPCISAAEHLTLAAVARVVRQALPRAIIAVGSYHANTLREKLMEQVPEIDFIFLGDIEPAAKDLMDRLRERDLGLIATMQNTIVRVDGRIHAHPYHSVAEEAESHFDYGVCRSYLKYYDCLASLGTKGCPYTCWFCQEKVLRRGYFQRSPADVIDEALQNLAIFTDETGEPGISYGFMDPIFGLNRRWLSDFCAELKRRPLGAPWGFQTRVGQLDTPQMDLLAETGCAVIYRGLETFSPEMLRRMNKTPDPDHYLTLFQRDVENARRLKIQLETNILFGFPGETEETLQEDRDGIAAMKVLLPNASFNLNLYRPLPDTQAYVASDTRWGSRLLIRDWWEKGITPGVTVIVQPSEQLRPEALLDFYREMYEDDACYQRRGVSEQMETFFHAGGIRTEDLTSITNRSRSQLVGPALSTHGHHG